MTGVTIHIVVPGSIHQRTGGYIYDARIAAGLRRRGWSVVVHELEGRFPSADDTARRSLGATLSGIPAGAPVVLDGLAMGGLPDLVQPHGRRLRLVALVHLLLGDETGLSETTRRDLMTREREALAGCHGVVATSTFTASRLEQLGVDPGVLRVVVPGTDRARPARGPGGGEAPRLLCVGTVTPRKAQDVLVRALEQVRMQRWQCVCVGSLTRDRAYADRVRRQVQAAGLESRIQLMGECDETTVEQFYETSSVFVLPSLFEGYGMVLTEAMARGLPVVTTTGGAIPDTVPADAGLFVPPADADALASALRTMVASDADAPADGPGPSRQKLAKAALAHAATLPTWDETTEAFAQAIQSLAPHRDG